MEMSKRAVVGIVLWWAEGTKSRRDKRWKNARSYPIELTNTNPAVIKIFVDFLREDLGIPNSRLHLQLQIHEGDEQEALEQYWSGVTSIPTNQFNKTIVRPVGHKIGKSKGTCKIRFVDKATYSRLEELLQEILADVYAQPELMLETLPHYEFVFKSVKIAQ